MIQNYKYVYFDGQKLEEVYNATLENDMYVNQIGGNRTIVEEKVPGRDVPHMFWIEKEPLSFSLTLAFNKGVTINEIKEYVRIFLNKRGYCDLQLVDESHNATPIYKVIVTESPEFTYKYSGDGKYEGFLVVSFRCNAPYGYEVGLLDFEDKSELIIDEIRSDEDSERCFIQIKNHNETGLENFTISTHLEGDNPDVTQASSITFSYIYPDEEITINQLTKRITSNMQGNSQLTNIYERWISRSFIELKTGYNKIIRSHHSGVKTTIGYELPRYI